MGLLTFMKRAKANVQARARQAAPPLPGGALSKLPAGMHAPGVAFAQQPMNVIQVPDLSRKLVTRYGLREKAPAPTLATEVVPVVLVDDLIGESDLIRPRIRPCAGQLAFNAAAETPIAGLMNPAGSRVICHVYYFVLSSTALSQWDLHFTGTPTITTAGVTGFRNGLMPGASPAGQMRGIQNGPSPGGAIEQSVRAVANNNFILPFDAVLDEGQGLQFRAQAAYTGLVTVNCVWTEEDKQ